MSNDMSWTWRFSEEGDLQFGQCTSTEQWRQQSANGWTKVSPTVVSNPMHMLATLHQQPNLYLIYRDNHPRADHSMEPERFQALYKGVADPMAYTPQTVCDLGTGFFLPPSFFLLRRLTVIPRPFDGATRRWDRMASIRAMGDPDAVPKSNYQRKTPEPGTQWETFGMPGKSKATMIATQEDEPFLYLHHTPRMYRIHYRLEGEDRNLLTIAERKADAEETFAKIQPDGDIISTVSALALPGLAIDLP